MYLVRKRSAGLIKKTLRKFECMALRNEIDVPKAWLCNLSVNRTKVWTYSEDGADFILSMYSNF